LRSERGAGVLFVDEALSVDEVDGELALLSVELLFMLLDEDEVDDVDDAPLFSELLPALSLLFRLFEFASAGEVEVDVAAGEPVDDDEPSEDDDEDWAQATPMTAARAAEAAVTTSLVWKLRM
jgi:hypothetical protein